MFVYNKTYTIPMMKPNVTGTVQITSEKTLVDNIVSNKYIVGSMSEPGGVSFSTHPVVHSTAVGAREECSRLAKLIPGKMYFFVKLAGAEKVPTQSSISI